jgi:ABC-type Fe3+/spermidine/putrescine transport system ATPase subunit
VIVVMRDGKIQQQGDPTDLYERPVNRFVADFIGTSNPLKGRILSVDEAARRAVVETDGGLKLSGLITDPAARPAVDSQITVAIRPEHLDVQPAGSSDPPGDAGEGNSADRSSGWTTIRGRVNQGTYLGDQTEYRVQTDRAGELVVRRQNQLGASTSQGMGPGDPVTVRWHEEANLVLVG